MKEKGRDGETEGRRRRKKKKKNTFPDSGVCVVTREVREGKRVKIKKH